MQSRELSSHSKIINQLNTLQLPYSCTHTTLPATENSQDQLNQIADQASNFGYGCGVALRKAIKNGINFCKKLEKQLEYSSPGFFDYWFSSNNFYTLMRARTASYDNKKIVNKCWQYVDEMEDDLKKLSKP